MTVLNILKSAAKASMKKLAEVFVSEVASATEFTPTLKLRARMLLTVFRGFNLVDEINMLRLLVTAECGRMGIEVPGGILDSDVRQVPALVPPVMQPVTLAAPKPQLPQPETSAPRMVETKEERLGKLMNLLGNFLKGERINFEKTRVYIASVLTSGAVLAQEQWAVLFSAMKKAGQNGFHLLDAKAKPPQVFSQAPADLLDDYVFGQDGALSLVLADFSEAREGMPGWLVGKSAILLDAIIALDDAGKLDDIELDKVEKLADAIDAAGGPEFLSEKIHVIFPSDKSQPTATAAIGNGGARIVGDLKSVVRKAATPEDHAEAQRSEARQKAADEARANIATAVA